MHIKISNRLPWVGFANPGLKAGILSGFPDRDSARHRFGTKARGSRAFTLLEMLLVVTIIGIIAYMALPHMTGFTKSNNMSVATRQLMDDVSLTRQRAMANRTTVYVVFLPTNYWSAARGPLTNQMFPGQLTSYAMLALRSVGDQPGQKHPQYLSRWKNLPDGVFIPPGKFTGYGMPLTIVDGTNKSFTVRALTNWAQVPFPSVGNVSNYLPCIAFNSQGGLVSSIADDEYIPLTRGSIFYPRDTNGVAYQKGMEPGDIIETPSGNWTNDYNIIHIDKLTGRAKLERKEIL